MNVKFAVKGSICDLRLAEPRSGVVSASVTLIRVRPLDHAGSEEAN
jgi:hypothetical protein